MDAERTQSPPLQPGWSQVSVYTNLGPLGVFGIRTEYVMSSGMKLNWCQTIGVGCVVAAGIILAGLSAAGVIRVLMVGGWLQKIAVVGLLLFASGIVIAVKGSK